MKKTFIISASSLALLFLSEINSEFLESIGIVLFHTFIILFLTGMMLILAQNETSSYKFIPKLLIGSMIVGSVFIITFQLINKDFNFGLFIEALLPMIFILFVGGLVGIVIGELDF